MNPRRRKPREAALDDRNHDRRVGAFDEFDCPGTTKAGEGCAIKVETRQVALLLEALRRSSKTFCRFNFPQLSSVTSAPRSA